MRYIPLTQNKYTIVDDADYPELSKYSWFAQKQHSGYYAIRNSSLINGKRHPIRMHRQILGLEHGDKRVGDHIHHNTLDNRRNNLRICTNAENLKNRKIKKEGKIQSS